jgi:hypothetical protein
VAKVITPGTFDAEDAGAANDTLVAGRHHFTGLTVQLPTAKVIAPYRRRRAQGDLGHGRSGSRQQKAIAPPPLLGPQA